MLTKETNVAVALLKEDAFLSIRLIHFEHDLRVFKQNHELCMNHCLPQQNPNLLDQVVYLRHS
jgi:hypothetical protein